MYVPRLREKSTVFPLKCPHVIVLTLRTCLESDSKYCFTRTFEQAAVTGEVLSDMSGTVCTIQRIRSVYECVYPEGSQPIAV